MCAWRRSRALEASRRPRARPSWMRDRRRTPLRASRTDIWPLEAASAETSTSSWTSGWLSSTSDCCARIRLACVRGIRVRLFVSFVCPSHPVSHRLATSHRVPLTGCRSSILKYSFEAEGLRKVRVRRDGSLAVRGRRAVEKTGRRDSSERFRATTYHL